MKLKGLCPNHLLPKGILM